MRTSFRVGKFRQDMNFLRLGRSWVIGYGRGDGSPLDDRHGSSAGYSQNQCRKVGSLKLIADRRQSPISGSFFGGLNFGEIPIAGSKRRSLAISIGGQLYRIGRIPANKAFVIIRGNLRLLYVAPDYRNYRYAAGKVFGTSKTPHDIDHALARSLTKHHGFWYTLVTRIDPRVNRSHGWRERLPPADPNKKIVLDKFCYTDERILSKILGVENAALPSEARWRGYDIVKKHGREVPISKALQARHALGMDGLDVLLPCLQPIPL